MQESEQHFIISISERDETVSRAARWLISTLQEAWRDELVIEQCFDASTEGHNVKSSSFDILRTPFNEETVGEQHKLLPIVLCVRSHSQPILI